MLEIILSSKKTEVSPPSLIVFFGDSITVGQGSSGGNYYAALVASAVGLIESNQGLSASALQDSADPVVSGYARHGLINDFPNNELVVIMYGTNDCLDVDVWSHNITDYQNEMNEILDNIIPNKQAENIFVCTIPPCSNLNANGTALRDAINSFIMGLGASKGVTVVDVAANCDIADYPDGTHPNNDGHADISTPIISSINSVIT